MKEQEKIVVAKEIRVFGGSQTAQENEPQLTDAEALKMLLKAFGPLCDVNKAYLDEKRDKTGWTIIWGALSATNQVVQIKYNPVHFQKYHDFQAWWTKVYPAGEPLGTLVHLDISKKRKTAE